MPVVACNENPGIALLLRLFSSLQEPNFLVNQFWYTKKIDIVVNLKDGRNIKNNYGENIMEFKELVYKRYSCRKFKNIPVEKEKIIQCIEAARVAPSACNAQPWRFIVYNDPEIKQKVAETATSGLYRFSKFIQAAPVLVMVLAGKGSFLSKMGSLVRNTRFYLMDIGIICEHIILQATELGLGTCYVGWFDEKAVKKLLNMPGNIEIPLIICMGYPDDSYKLHDPIRRRAESETRKSVNDILLFNEFRL